MYTFKQPGLYAYLNHNHIEAIELGAVAHVNVEGEWDDDLMTQVKAPTLSIELLPKVGDGLLRRRLDSLDGILKNYTQEDSVRLY